MKPLDPLRLLHLIHTPRHSGAESLVRTLCELHAGLGHTCGIASFAPPQQSYESAVNILKQRRVSLYFPEVAKAKWARIAHFARVYREFEPDIVFAHSALPALYGRLALPILGARPRFVSVLHSVDDYADRRLRAVENVVGRRTDAIIAVSAECAQMYRQRLSCSLPLIVIPNGIDLEVVRRAKADRNEHRKRYALAASDKLVLQVGRLYPLKQQLLSLSAMRPLMQANTSIHLWFAGLAEDHTYAEELRRAIDAAGLSERARVLGSREDVPMLLASADLYLMPSQREAHSVAMLEALAVGVPIVASDIASFRFAHELRYVTLIGELTSESLREAITKALHEPLVSRELHEFDIKLTAERYLACARALVPGFQRAAKKVRS